MNLEDSNELGTLSGEETGLNNISKRQSNSNIVAFINEHPVLKSFLTGAFSGTCSTLMFQPLDLIKTRLQNTNGSRLGTMSLIIQVVRKEKLIGFWKGTVPSVARCVPGVGMYFASLHWLQVSLGKQNPGPLEAVCLGVFARSLAGAVLLPFTVVKTRFEILNSSHMRQRKIQYYWTTHGDRWALWLDISFFNLSHAVTPIFFVTIEKLLQGEFWKSGIYSYKSLSSALRTLYINEGTRGLFSGLIPTLFRDAPFSGIYLLFYTQTKKLIPFESRNYSPYLNFLNGLCAGACASVLTQPADVIKTRTQLYPEKYRRLRTTIVSVYRERGIPGFFSGLLPRLVRRTLVAAVSWTIYERIMRGVGIR